MYVCVEAASATSCDDRASGDGGAGDADGEPRAHPGDTHHARQVCSLFQVLINKVCQQIFVG